MGGTYISCLISHSNKMYVFYCQNENVPKGQYSTIRVVHEHSVPLIGGARLWTCHHGPDSDVRAHFGWTFQPSRFLGVIGQFSDYHI